mmetsp:Transcript_2574/g.7869  ORF Transcript_2574/g.7869 Transcript_2574/m.7869 type:complete len:326 (+) Transcript_2574:132-1109(+)
MRSEHVVARAAGLATGAERVRRGFHLVPVLSRALVEAARGRIFGDPGASDAGQRRVVVIFAGGDREVRIVRPADLVLVLLVKRLAVAGGAGLGAGHVGRNVLFFIRVAQRRAHVLARARKDVPALGDDRPLRFRDRAAVRSVVGASLLNGHLLGPHGVVSALPRRIVGKRGVVLPNLVVNRKALAVEEALLRRVLVAGRTIRDADVAERGLVARLHVEAALAGAVERGDGDELRGLAGGCGRRLLRLLRRLRSRLVRMRLFRRLGRRRRRGAMRVVLVRPRRGRVRTRALGRLRSRSLRRRVVRLVAAARTAACLDARDSVLGLR